MEKKLYDMRGSQSNIIRLAGFDIEGFIHMLFFRILVFISMIYGIVLLLSFLISVPLLLIKLLTALVWVLITPQLFESVKMLSMISTGGLSFGHFSQERVFLEKSKYKVRTGFFDIMPYGAMLLWLMGFFIMLVWWTV
jgi:hypothetical protein